MDRKKHARFPCPSPNPRAYSNSCPLSQWCDPNISCSVIPFSSRLQSFPASKFFSNESALHIRWPKYWIFSFSLSPSKEQSGSISFRMDWLDLLAVQATFKSLLQHHSSKASILQCSAFFIVWLLYPYMTTSHRHPNVHCSTIYSSQTWEQPKCPSTEVWVKKMWYIHMM